MVWALRKEIKSKMQSEKLRHQIETCMLNSN